MLGGGDANGPSQRLDRKPDVLPLHLLWHVVLRPPPPPVAADVDAVTVVAYVRRALRQHLKRHRAGVHRARQPALLEHLHDAPEADPAAVLEERLCTHVAHAGSERASAVCEDNLAHVVAVVEGGLRALLEVDHEVDRQLGPLWPLRVRVVPRITLQVARGAGDRARWRRSEADEPIAALARLRRQTGREAGYVGRCARWLRGRRATMRWRRLRSGGRHLRRRLWRLALQVRYDLTNRENVGILERQVGEVCEVVALVLVGDALDGHDCPVAPGERFDCTRPNAAARRAAGEYDGVDLVIDEQRLQRRLVEGRRHLLEVHRVLLVVDLQALVELAPPRPELDVLQRVWRVGPRAPDACIRGVFHVRHVGPDHGPSFRARDRRQLVDVVNLLRVCHVARLELAISVGVLEVHVDDGDPFAEAKALSSGVGHHGLEYLTRGLRRLLHMRGWRVLQPRQRPTEGRRLREATCEHGRR
mmetsp:Transcript_35607/g.96576  ORF Transcript_35607/g.96576 Transcript_35607/m.96576 type:complete len:474 (+) Transcript_35607:517-1938(+)